MPDNPFQREIKRSGYLRGTQMRKIRNRFIFGTFALTIGSYALAYYFYKPEEGKHYKTIQKERKWTEERNKRFQEAVEMKKRLMKNKSELGRSE